MQREVFEGKHQMTDLVVMDSAVQAHVCWRVGIRLSGSLALKTRLEKLALEVCSECKRSLGGVLKACDPAQACMCEGAPV